MNTLNKINKTNFKIKLCQIIVRRNQTYMKELSKILQERDGYKYNDKQKKKEKHFPAQYMIYEEYVKKYRKKNGNITSSLSSKSVPEQIQEMINTAQRRCNFTDIFEDETLDNIVEAENKHGISVITPLDYRNNLLKYDNQEHIASRFPSLINMFDVIYTIKTENPHHYIDLKNKKFCDTILICCKNKTFNIFFELDIKDPYYTYLNEFTVPESIQKELYDNKHI